jgi:competence protein ComEA
MQKSARPQHYSNLLWILIVLIVIVGVGFAGVYLVSRFSSDDSETAWVQPENFQTDALPFSTPVALPTTPEIQPTPTPEPVVVYVSGAVQKPDVYRLPSDARIKDVILAAGGMTNDADWERINLADHLFDTQHIHVPRIEELIRINSQEPIDSGEPSTTQSNQSTTNTANKQININIASATELQELKGIGKVLSQRIVDYRSENGPFTSIEDVQQVRGVSLALFETIRPSITTGK